MSTLSVEESTLKNLVKEAILELMHDKRDDFEEVLAEVVEDIGLTKAIEEGESTESVDRAEILRVLEQ